MPSFRVIGLAAEEFDPLFAMSDAELSSLGARRVIADAKPGYPCRVSLADAEVGEELLLLSYQHLGARSPYRASGPLFVRARARRPELEPGFVPPCVTHRLMSVRAYDANDMMIAGELCEGADVAPLLERLMSGADVAFVHLHNAKRGCFSCRVERVG